MCDKRVDQVLSNEHKSHADALLNASSPIVASVNAGLLATVAQYDPEYAAALRCVPSDDEPVTGVYSIHDVDWDCVTSLEELDVGYEDAKREHEAECPICRGEVEGDCDFFIDYMNDGGGGRAYADTNWVFDEETQEWDAPDATLLILENESTVQVVKSPHTERSGWCSPSYPGQADPDSVGDILHYALPPDCLRGVWIYEGANRRIIEELEQRRKVTETKAAKLVERGHAAYFTHRCATCGEALPTEDVDDEPPQYCDEHKGDAK